MRLPVRGGGVRLRARSPAPPGALARIVSVASRARAAASHGGVAEVNAGGTVWCGGALVRCQPGFSSRSRTVELVGIYARSRGALASGRTYCTCTRLLSDFVLYMHMYSLASTDQFCIEILYCFWAAG